MDKLKKSTRKKRFGYFNPRNPHSDEFQNILDSFTGVMSDPGARETAVEDFKDRPMRDAERARALHKLSSKTRVKRDQNTGERLFLLHRGMSEDERNKSVTDQNIEHDAPSSWTPHFHVAHKFAADYNFFGAKMKPEDVIKEAHKHVHSAWIPESKIETMPNMYADPEGYSGVRRYRSEDEAMVAPHKSAKASQHEVARQLSSFNDYTPKLKERLGAYKGKLKKPEKLASSLEHKIYKKLQKSDFTSKKLTADSIPPNWRDHNVDLVQGAETNKDASALKLDSGKSITGNILKVPHGDGHVIIKPALSPELFSKESAIHTNPDAYSHFGDKEFTTAHREALFSHLGDKVFGLGDNVAQSALFAHPDTGEFHSSQKFIDGAPLSTMPHDALKQYRSNDLHKLAIMDSILGNNDRHRGNVVLDNQKIKLIDNGMSFDYAHLLQHTLPSYVKGHENKDVSSGVASWIHGLDEDKLRDAMSYKGAPEYAIKHAVNRLKEAKFWTHFVNGNRGSNKSLGGLLSAMMINRHFHDLVDQKQVSKALYKLIMRGERINVDGGAGSEDKTA